MGRPQPRQPDVGATGGGGLPRCFDSIYYGRPKGMPAFRPAHSAAEGVWTLVTLPAIPAGAGRCAHRVLGAAVRGHGSAAVMALVGALAIGAAGDGGRQRPWERTSVKQQASRTHRGQRFHICGSKISMAQSPSHG